MKKNKRSSPQFINQLIKLKQKTSGPEVSKSSGKQDISVWEELVYAAPLSIIALDNKGLVTIWNPAAEYMFGWQKDEVLNQPLYLLREDKSDELRILFERALKGKSLADLEMFRRKKDGTSIYVSVSVAPLNDAKGDITGAMAVISDMTKRKAIEDALKMAKEYYRLIVENSPDCICNIPLIGRNVEINGSGIHNIEFNKPEEACIISGAGKIIENRQEVELAIKRAAKGETVSVQFKSKGEDKKELWWESKLTPIRGVDGVVRSILSVSRDITERKSKEEREKIMTEGLRQVVEAADDLISCQNIDSLFKFAVEFAREKLGLERCAIFIEDSGYMQGTYGTDRYGHTTDEHGQRFPKSEVWQERLKLLKSHDPRWFSVNEPLYEWDGKKIVEIHKGWVAITPIQSMHTPIGIFVNDTAITKLEIDTVKQEVLVVFCSLLGNIAERKRIEKEREVLNNELIKSNKKLKQLSVMDSHTGLYNHRYFTEIIGAEFERTIRYNYPLSILMLDIDYFKAINDVYGHTFGDVVLRQFAKYLKKTVRRYDIVIRFGGEEFLVISPGVERAKALVLGKRILAIMNTSKFGTARQNVKLKVSVGVASYPEDKVVNASELIRLADQILRKVKEYGGNLAYSSADLKKEKPEDGELNTEFNSLKEKIERLTKRANQTLMEALFAFSKTLQVKDKYVSEDTDITVYYATELAKSLGLNNQEVENIRKAAYLYDLGKVGISTKILQKAAKLSKNEFDKIKKHPQLSADIIRPVDFLHSLIPVILYHHERWDGKGYPRGLKGDEIIMGARILAIADTYKALTSSRPYRKKSLSKEEIMKIFKAGSGTQFDPKLVGEFLKILQKKR